MWNLIKRIIKMFKKVEVEEEVTVVDEMQVKMIFLEPRTKRTSPHRAKEMIHKVLNITETAYYDRPRISYTEWVENARRVDEIYRRRFAS